MIPKAILLNKLLESGVIAILRQLPEDKLEQTAESLVSGGVTALEVTVQSPSAFAMIQTLASKLKGRAVVGAGTVLDSETARLAINSGAEFILSPSLHQDVIRTTLRYGKVSIPGVATPTEMVKAMEWGADMVKLFPAGSLGVQYLKDVRGPLPHIPVVPTGGINLDNVASFFEVGAVAVGVGGSLVDMNLINNRQFDEITSRASRFVDAIRGARVK